METTTLKKGDEMLISFKHKQTITSFTDREHIEIRQDVPDIGWLAIKCSGLCDNCDNNQCFVNIYQFGGRVLLDLNVDSLDRIKAAVESLPTSKTRG